MAEPVATIALIISLAKFGYDVVKDLRSRAGNASQKQLDARISLLRAARETKEYLEYLEDGGEQRREREKELSELWQEAGGRIYQINDELGDRLMIKAEYWMNPKEWPKQKIEEARIGFKSIQTELENMRNS
jgi:hypothetical protein